MHGPARFLDEETLADIMKACIIWSLRTKEILITMTLIEVMQIRPISVTCVYTRIRRLNANLLSDQGQCYSF